MKKVTLFLWLYTLLNLHLLRNVSLTGYVVTLALIYIPVMAYCLSRLTTVKMGKIALWFLLFLVTALWASIITFTNYGIAAGAYASVRYFLTMPMALVAYLLLPSEASIRKVLLVLCFIVLVGVLTIPLQYVIGPIPWFAEPGERANMTRYASILGSLPVAGGVIPYAVLAALVLRMNKLIKATLVFLLFICAVLTLQKAALLGIPLAVGVYLLYVRKRKLFNIAVIGLLMVILGTVTAFVLKDWPVWHRATDYAYAAFQLGKSPEALGGDVSVQESVIARLTDLPRRSLDDLYSLRGAAGYLFGGGFGMVGAALMRPGDSPFITAHNGYVDLVLIGGIVHFLAFVGLVCYVVGALRTSLKNCRTHGLDDEILVVLIGIITIALFALFFAGGLTFQPVTGSLFWTVVGIACRLENRILSKG